MIKILKSEHLYTGGISVSYSPWWYQEQVLNFMHAKSEPFEARARGLKGKVEKVNNTDTTKKSVVKRLRDRIGL